LVKKNEKRPPREERWGRKMPAGGKRNSPISGKNYYDKGVDRKSTESEGREKKGCILGSRCPFRTETKRANNRGEKVRNKNDQRLQKGRRNHPRKFP